MYSVIFTGEFQMEYPEEFLKEFEELKDKHSVDHFGLVKMKNLGTFVDFQKQEDANTDDNNTDIQSEN